MIVDSVFICFCEDCDINDGEQKPYYMSKEMMVSNAGDIISDKEDVYMMFLLLVYHILTLG